MERQEVEQSLQWELDNQQPTTPVVSDGEFPLATVKKDKKHQQSMQRMSRKGQSRALAIKLIVALHVYAQGQLEAGAVTMTERLFRIQEERADVVVAYMTKVTGKLMIMQQAGVMAVLETFSPSLGEDL